jgi:hypothetical protein
LEPDFTLVLSFSLAVILVQVGVLLLIDVNEKEPLWALLALIWLGAVSAAVASLAVAPVTSGIGIALASQVAKLAAIAAGFGLLALVGWRRGWFELSGIVDGAIYGAAAGFGFAVGDALLRDTFTGTIGVTSELQVPDQTTFLELLWMTVQSSLVEGALGALLGAGVAGAILGPGRLRRFVLPPAALAIAVGAHWVFGALALEDFQVGPSISVASAVAILALLGLAGVVFARGLSEESAAIDSQLRSESTEVASVEERGALARPGRRLSAQLGKLVSGDIERLLADRALQNRQVRLALVKQRLQSTSDPNDRSRLDEQAAQLRLEIQSEREAERRRLAERTRASTERSDPEGPERKPLAPAKKSVGAGRVSRIVERLALLIIVLAVLAAGGGAIAAAAGPNQPTTSATKSALFEREQEGLRDFYPRPIRTGIENFVGPWRLGEASESSLAEEGALEAFDLEYGGGGHDSVRYTIASFPSPFDAEGALDTLESGGAGVEDVGWVDGAHVTLLQGGTEDVTSFCGSLPRNRRPPNRLQAFRDVLDESLGDEWRFSPTRQNSVRFVNVNGSANILGTAERLGPITSEAYANNTGLQLERGFAEYEELSLDRTDLRSAVGGFRRVYEWTPPDGRRVRQVQVYIAECRQGYVFTATALATDFSDFERAFASAFDSL